MAPFKLFDAMFKPSRRLKLMLKAARLDIPPKKFIKRSIIIAFYFSFPISFLLFVLFSKIRQPKVYAILAFPALFIFFYTFFSNIPRVYIRRRERELNKDIIFATHYLLIKIDSGVPLLNAMIDASQSYGVAGKFFKEIVDDISLGKPIEQALEDAIKYSTSRFFKLVLRQILNSLKTGVDVSTSLKKLVDEITKEQQIEIKTYSRKLNSIILFYLIVACVIPSLGLAMFIIFSSLLNLNLQLSTLFMFLFFIALIQLFFVSVIRSARPMIDI